MGNQAEASVWWSSASHPTFTPGELYRQWDVVIVGGGYSGMWTAHHLLNSSPDLSIAILEAHQVGSGASGRNGGWASALYPIEDGALAKHASAQSISNLHTELEKSIDEIGQFAAQSQENIAFLKSGSLTVARSNAQFERIKKGLLPRESILDRDQTLKLINMSQTVGSSFNPDCATINPTQLVVALAKSLAQRGVHIFENTFAEITSDGVIKVAGKIIESKFVVRAIEAYHEKNREQIPIYSLMIATEPLPDEFWNKYGLDNRPTFHENRHLVTYAQRTADNRIAMGGRGAPYKWGSARSNKSERHAKIHKQLRETAIQWFPELKNYSFTHAWGGAVTVKRDWAPYLQWDGRFGTFGGYVGDGVTLSYLAANSMADLILGKNTVRASLPYVGWKSAKWEPEPLRWLGVNLGIKLSELADIEEKLTRRPSLLGKLIEKLL
ncbi:MAG: FAD-dependent oxidoreductase [Actinomycetes bacterium]|jgi:glycine/D-amino acid oxidase-like deaminating enzyme